MVIDIHGREDGRDEAIRGHDCLEFSVQFLGDRGQWKSLDDHAVKHLSQRQGAQRRRKAVPGGIGKHQVEHAVRTARGAHQVAAERSGGDVEPLQQRVFQAIGVGQPVDRRDSPGAPAPRPSLRQFSNSMVCWRTASCISSTRA